MVGATDVLIVSLIAIGSVVLVGLESNRERNNDVSNNHAHNRGSIDDASVGR